MFKKIKIDKRTFSLFLLVITTFFLSQSYSAATTYAQTESGSATGVTKSPTESVLVCEFVQFCSNPVESSRSDNETATITPVTPETEAQTTPETEAQTTPETEAQTTPETEAQTTPETEAQTTPDSSELVPDVTSNISLIMTPDLPGNLAEEDSQNPVGQDLSNASETSQVSLNASEDSQVVVPENATVITPDAQVPLEVIGENISTTIQDDNETIAAGSSLNNQTEFGETVPPNNITMSIDATNMSQNAPLDLTIDTTGANETIDTTGANETIDTTGANETIDTTGANETIDTTGANETIDTTGANETIDTTGANETIDTVMPADTENQSTTSNEALGPATSNIDQQGNASNVNVVQPASSPTPQNQTAPASFLDPIINPFKELFGIK